MKLKKLKKNKFLSLLMRGSQVRYLHDPPNLLLKGQVYFYGLPFLFIRLFVMHRRLKAERENLLRSEARLIKFSCKAKRKTRVMAINLTDEQLVEQAVNENSEAFGEIVKRWERKIFALCFGMLGREDVAP